MPMQTLIRRRLVIGRVGESYMTTCTILPSRLLQNVLPLVDEDSGEGRIWMGEAPLELPAR